MGQWILTNEKAGVPMLHPKYWWMSITVSPPVNKRAIAKMAYCLAMDVMMVSTLCTDLDGRH